MKLHPIVTMTFFLVTFLQVNGAPLDLTKEDMEVLAWKPPKGMYEKFPYYLTGVDKEGSLVMMIDIEKWDVAAYIDSAPSIEVATENVEKYFHQLILRAVKSTIIYKAPNKKYRVIYNVEELGLKQILHFPALHIFFREVQKYMKQYGDHEHLKFLHAVNANTIFDIVFGLTLPFVGPIHHKIHVTTSDDPKWKDKLLDHIHPHQLSHHLGGTKFHRPFRHNHEF